MYKRLFRSEKSKIIGGVAGGLAEYFDIDPVIVRAAFIVSAFAWGISIPAYIVMWIIIPVNPNQKEQFQEISEETDSPHKDFSYETRKHNGRLIAGIIIILIGIISLLHNIMPDIHFSYIWPMILIAIGIIILYKSSNHKNKEVHNEE